MNEVFPPAGFTPVESKVSGITVFAPAPEKVEYQEVVEFACPQCGATTAYSVAEGGLKCAHCGYYQPPDAQVVGKRAAEFEFTVDTVDRAEIGWGSDRKELECQSCGAKTSIPSETLAHTCAFCGSNQVIQREAPQDVLRPRFLVPFKVDASQSRTIAANWLKASWMTPSALKQAASLGGFTGIYLPYWTFDAITSANWKAEVGHTETERYYEDGEWKTRMVTKWRWESGRAQLNIDDLIVEGTNRLSRLLLGQIKTYDLRALTAYQPDFLAGQHALAYDVPLTDAWEMARQEMREQTKAACRSQASTTNIRNFSMSLDFSDESWRYILLPVYLSAYRYREQVFQVMINGQTGAIAGQRPVDWTKIWLVIAGLMSPGLLLSFLGLLTIALGGLGVAVGGVGLVLLVIGLVISIIILVKASRMDDI